MENLKDLAAILEKGLLERVIGKLNGSSGAVGSGQWAVGSVFRPIFISEGGENPSPWTFIVKMRQPPRETPRWRSGRDGSHPGEMFVFGGEGAPGLLANAGNACLNVPGLVGLDK